MKRPKHGAPGDSPHCSACKAGTWPVGPAVRQKGRTIRGQPVRQVRVSPGPPLLSFRPCLPLDCEPSPRPLQIGSARGLSFHGPRYGSPSLMLAKLNTFTLVGIDAVAVEAEVDVSAGLPKTVIVGLPE